MGDKITGRGHGKKKQHTFATSFKKCHFKLPVSFQNAPKFATFSFFLVCMWVYFLWKPAPSEDLHPRCLPISLFGNIISELTTTVSTRQDFATTHECVLLCHYTFRNPIHSVQHFSWSSPSVSVSSSIPLWRSVSFTPPTPQRPEGSSWTLRVAAEPSRRKNRQIREV